MNSNSDPDCVINPRTRRAVKQSGRLGKKIMKTESNPEHDCIINPRTGRAVTLTGLIGRKLRALEREPKSSQMPKNIFKKKPEAKTNALDNRIKLYYEAKVHLNKIDPKQCLRKVNWHGKETMTLAKILMLDTQIGTKSKFGAIYLSKIRKVDGLLVASKVTDKSSNNLTEITIMERITKNIMLQKKSKHFPLIYSSHLCEDTDTRRSLVSVNELCDGDIKTLLNNPNMYPITEELFFNLLIQVFISLGTFHFHFNVRHNDAHYGNFLYQKNEEKGYYKYKISSKTFYLKSCDYNIMLYDFGLVRPAKEVNDYYNDYYRIIHAFIPEEYGGWNDHLQDEDLASKMLAIQGELKELIAINARFSFTKVLNAVLQYAPEGLYENDKPTEKILNSKPFEIN